MMDFRSESIRKAVFFKKIVGDTQFTDARIQGLNQFFFGLTSLAIILIEYCFGLLDELPFPDVDLIGMDVVLLR
jgi:hypothetical protein